MHTSAHDGFILQATYRIHAGHPVVYLFGRLLDGRTFLVRDTRQRPHFYIAADQVDAVIDATVRTCALRTMQGMPVAEIEVLTPADAPVVRDALHARGIATYEADVRFATRFLIDRGIRGGVRIHGLAQPGQGTDVDFLDPELEPLAAMLVPRTLAFDIETDAQAQRLLAIAVYAPESADGTVIDAVVVVDPQGRTMPPGAVGVASERQALQWFAQRVKQVDPDILTGWNVIDFDLTVLARIAQRCAFDLQLGRVAGRMRLQPAQGYFGSGQASVPGRLVLDGIALLRGAFVKMEDYSLATVAMSVLGEGKTLGGEGRDKLAEILQTYQQDLPAFARYARTDARLALQIVEKLDLLQLSMARAALTGMTPDRVAASIASFDYMYLSALRVRGMVAPTVRATPRTAIAQAGGAVLEPKVGMHRNVWVCDFKSLYPSIMRTFNIDPLGYEQGQQGVAVLRTHDGTAFARAPGILPSLLDDLVPRRAQAQAAGDMVAAQAIKILMNSFYGVLGTPACRFYAPVIANAITAEGRHLLHWSRRWFEARGFKVLYGDTDSLFVASGLSDPGVAEQQARVHVGAFNQELAHYVQTTAGVDSRLELVFEKLYTTLFLPAVRGGPQGARKRYAGLVYGRPEPEFVGLEVVRRDWTELARQVQRTLFKQLFAGEEVTDYLRQTVAALRRGELDDWLVYRKALRKPVDSYVTHVPPHVQAVKKSGAPPPRIVSYVITTQGAELLAERQHPLDREHYLERQIRPVATPVLEVLGLEFSRVIGDDRQIALF